MRLKFSFTREIKGKFYNSYIFPLISLVNNIKSFDFIPNTGYLNDLTGSDSEKVYHGMLNPVPENTYRISSYTQFWTE